LIYSLIDFSWI